MYNIKKYPLQDGDLSLKQVGELVYINIGLYISMYKSSQAQSMEWILNNILHIHILVL